MSEHLIPASRVERWVANFESRHGETELVVADGFLHGTALDLSSFEAQLPFGRAFAGSGLSDFVDAATAPELWGVLLVRKGGFAVARLEGLQMVESKVGQRHVQGRTKAGGQSQQRFARRRDNQAKAAYLAAAQHAQRILPATQVVAGGDRTAVRAVLSLVNGVEVVGRWLEVPDPRRSVLQSAVLDACSVKMTVSNAT